MTRRWRPTAEPPPSRLLAPMVSVTAAVTPGHRSPVTRPDSQGQRHPTDRSLPVSPFHDVGLALKDNHPSDASDSSVLGSTTIRNLPIPSLSNRIPVTHRRAPNDSSGTNTAYTYFKYFGRSCSGFRRTPPVGWLIDQTLRTAHGTHATDSLEVRVRP